MTSTVLENTHPVPTDGAVTTPDPAAAERTDVVDPWQLLHALPATDDDELPLFGRLVA